MPDTSPELTLHNTLTRRQETLEPTEHDAEGHPLLRVYGCGPTVYSLAHIGNFRSFLTTDLLLRTARALGWRTKYVSNVTDVGHLTDDDVADATGEDKMAKALQSKEGERFANVWDLARHYTGALLDDWRALNLLEPDVRPRAAEHVRDQIEAVEALIEKGHAYETASGVYFHVPSFPDYGKLSGNRDAEGLEAGAAGASRDVVTDDEKRDPRDFALWKKDPGHLMQWHSPFGAGTAWGFPGWHIECSVMAQRYLGETIDVHTGGEDLIFPHHECEIAQAESLTGEPFARMWLHTRFLRVEGEKMSKSAGNFITVRDLIAPEPGGRGIDPLAVRYALLSGHYRKPFNFTEKNLKAAVKLTARIRHAYDVLIPQAEARGGEERDEDAALGELLDDAYHGALAGLCDDLNTPVALREVLAGVGHISAYDLNAHSAKHAKTFLDKVNALLGIVRHEGQGAPTDAADPFAEKVDALVAERVEARQAKDWARADAIRDELDALGVEVMDSSEGSTWRKKASV
jgi:cysteinyl-tRNA synthetase